MRYGIKSHAEEVILVNKATTMVADVEEVCRKVLIVLIFNEV